MVFLGVVCEIRLKYSKELLDMAIKLKILKLTLLIIRVAESPSHPGRSSNTPRPASC